MKGLMTAERIAMRRDLAVKKTQDDRYDTQLFDVVSSQLLADSFPHNLHPTKSDGNKKETVNIVHRLDILLHRLY